MSAHTPGPWFLGTENNHGADVQCGETTISLDRTDPHTGSYVISREELLANTHLVMAAPDLLVALESLMDTNGDQTYCLSVKGCGCCHECTARAAIAKARGGK